MATIRFQSTLGKGTVDVSGLAGTSVSAGSRGSWDLTLSGTEQQIIDVALLFSYLAIAQLIDTNVRITVDDGALNTVRTFTVEGARIVLRSPTVAAGNDSLATTTITHSVAGDVGLAMKTIANNGATDEDLSVVSVGILVAPHPVPGSLVNVFVGGLDQTALVLMQTIEVQLQLHTRGSAAFSIIMTDEQNGAGNYFPRVGQTTRIEYEGDDVFAGTIEGVTIRQERGVTDHVFVEIASVSWEQICDRKLVAASFEDRMLSDIVQTITQDLLSPEGITVANVHAGPTISRAVWNYETVTQVFNDLAGLAGFDWWIDTGKALHFVASGSEVAPVDVGVAFPAESAVLRRERQDYRNKQFVRAGNDVTDTRVESMAGDGKKQAFPVSFSVGGKPPRITVNGVAETVGVRGAEQDDEKEWFYQLGSDNISQSSDGTPLSSSDTLEVTYEGLFPLLVIFQDDAEISTRQAVEGGTGIYEAVEDRQEIDEGQFAFDIAQRLLRQKGIIPATLTIRTRQKGFRPAQLLPTSLPGIGIHEDLLIETVEFQESSATPIEFLYTLSCVSGAALGGWAEFFRTLARAGKKFSFRENEVAGPLRLFPEVVDFDNPVFSATLAATTGGVWDVDEWGKFQWT